MRFSGSLSAPSGGSRNEGAAYALRAIPYGKGYNHQMSLSRRIHLVLAFSALALLAACGASWFFVGGEVREVMATDDRAIRPFALVALQHQDGQDGQGDHGYTVEWLGGGEVRAVAVSPDSLYPVGSFAIADDGPLLGLVMAQSPVHNPFQ